MRRLKKPKEDAELDVTSFMNLMVVLVPVLLLNMVFAQTTVLQIKLPEGVTAAIQDPNNKNESIELIVRDTHLLLNYPAGKPVAQFDKKEDGKHDWENLSKTLQAVKNEFIANDKEKKDILLLLEAKTDYQTIVTAMDTVRSYDDVVALDVVSYELFPEISLGDAPGFGSESAAEGGAQ